jgi:hypothetical protein
MELPEAWWAARGRLDAHELLPAVNALHGSFWLLRRFHAHYSGRCNAVGGEELSLVRCDQGAAVHGGDSPEVGEQGEVVQ